MMKFLVAFFFIFSVLAPAVASNPGYIDANGINNMAHTKAIALPNASGTLSCIACTETLSNKTIEAANGTLTAPSISFINNTDSGLYRAASGEIGLAVTGFQAFDLKPSTTGSFANVGIGGAASVSPNYIVLEQRDTSVVGGFLNHQLSNPSTTGGYGAQLQVLSDGGNNYLDIASIPAASAAPDIYAGGGGVIRFTTAGGTSTDMVLVTDASASSSIRFYAGGDASTNKIVTMNSSGLTLANSLPFNGAGTGLTGTAANLTAGHVTTNANLTGDVTSAGNATTSAATQSNITSIPNLATVGTIASGTWNGSSIAINHGGTGQTTAAAAFNALAPSTATGGLILGSGANTYLNLPIGTNGNCLVSNGTTATWTTCGTTSPLTTKGDIYTYSTTNARQPVPADGGEIIADSAQTTGWRSASYTTKLNGKPGKNYIQYADFENGATTGWTLGTVGTLTNGLPTGSPTFGSGASGNLSLAVESSGQLAGADSLGYVSSAATTAGNMVASSSYAIDAADQAKVLTVKFYYQAAVGPTLMNMSGTSANSYAWALWDVTNSSWLSSAGNFCMTQTSGVGYCTGTAQTNATTANIRLVVYNANATATGAASLYFDDFYVGPQTAPSGPAVGDWVSYTPTLSSFGTVTSLAAYYRRAGDSMEVAVSFTAGTPVGSLATVTLPNGLNIDGTKLPTNASVGVPGSAVGYYSLSEAAASQTGNILAYPGTNANLLYFSTVMAASGSQLVDSNANSVTAANIPIYLYAKVPIAGWSSNAVQSSDTLTRVVASSAKIVAGTFTSSATIPINFDTVIFDKTGSITTSATAWMFKAPVTGLYQVNLSGLATNSASVINAGVFLNGTTYSYFTSGNNTASTAGSRLVPMNAGDFIDIRMQSSVGVLVGAVVDVFLLSGPAVVQATESVGFNANTSTTAATTSTPFVYSAAPYNTHNAYSASTGKFTAPVSGNYHFEATAYTGSTEYLTLNLNGAILIQGLPASASTVANVAGTTHMNAGDTMEARPSASVTASGGAASNAFSGYRVGN